MEISYLEKLVVNAYTPVDRLGRALFRDNPELAKSLCPGMPDKDFNQSTFDYKVRSYTLLLNKLERGYDERFVSRYMRVPCGRLQVRMAKHRGLITNEQYAGLKKYY